MGQQVLAIACGTFAGTGTGTDASIGMSYMHALACLACTHDSIGILHASVTASSAQKARVHSVFDNLDVVLCALVWGELLWRVVVLDLVPRLDSRADLENE